MVSALADLRWNCSVIVVVPFDFFFSFYFLNLAQKLSRSPTAKETLNAAEWEQMTVEVQLLGRLEVILTDMGSGTSRGKRVAPARVREAHAISRINARNRSQQEQQQSCRSEGRDPDRSSSSRDDDAIDGDADTAAADEQEQSWACVKKSPTSQKKKKKKSRSYGLCRSRQEDEDSSVEEPRGSRDVNKRAFLHVRKQTATPSGHVTVRTLVTL